MLRPHHALAPLLACLLVAAGCSSEESKADPTGGAGGTGGGGTGGEGGTPLAGPATGQVTRYDYSLSLLTNNFTTALSIDVAPPGGDCFDVTCRVDPVSSLQWNGAPAARSSSTTDTLEVCGEAVGPGPTLEIGGAGHIPVGTFLSLDVGLSHLPDLAGGEFTYLLSWVGGCDHFGPCDNVPSALSEFHFEITHEADGTVLCPGERQVSDGLTTCDIAGTLAPTYSAFAVASDPLWIPNPWLTTAAGVDLVFYEVPGGGIANALDPVSVDEYMTWITDMLGPFPYGNELRVAGGPTYWLGFEHPANILLQESLDTIPTDYTDGPMHVLMHEIAHQWAGDRVTLATAEDFVWKEATAEYLAYVFEDEQRPLGEAAATRTYWDIISQYSVHYPRPTDNPPPAIHNFYGDVYGPGPMVLYLQLETILGRATVLDAIKSFLSTPGARSVDDLRVALEQASGEMLKPYFDAWVMGEGVPEWPGLSVTLDQVGGDVTVTVTQDNPSGKLYGCIVEVEVTGPTLTERVLVDFGVAPTSATASTTIPFAETPTGFAIDPDHRLVTRDLAMPVAPKKARPVWLF